MTKPPGIVSVGKPSKYLRLMVHSNPGWGKTVLAGTSPNCLIIRPPTDHTDSIPPPATGVDEWVVKDWDDMASVEEYARHAVRKDGYEWVWLDSISLMQDHLLDHVWADTVARKPARADYGLDKSEYGINFTRLGIWMRNMVAIEQFHFGVTAHSFETTDQNGDPVLMPWVQGKMMPEKFCGYMNMVGYLNLNKVKGETKRELLVRESGSPLTIYAKNQYPKAFPTGKILDPTIPKIMQAIQSTRPARTTRRPAAARRRRTA